MLKQKRGMNKWLWILLIMILVVAAFIVYLLLFSNLSNSDYAQYFQNIRIPGSDSISQPPALPE